MTISQSYCLGDHIATICDIDPAFCPIWMKYIFIWQPSPKDIHQLFSEWLRVVSGSLLKANPASEVSEVILKHGQGLVDIVWWPQALGEKLPSQT